jgi:hypothetical protein
LIDHGAVVLSGEVGNSRPSHGALRVDALPKLR